MQNLAPGATSRLNFGAEALREENSRLVHFPISGYGEGGPHEKKAYDPLVQCEAGLVSITGTALLPPATLVGTGPMMGPIPEIG